MWEEIVKLAMSNGLWAVLFLGLLVYQLKDSKLREQKYQDTITILGEKLQVVEEIKRDIVVIMNSLEKKKTTKSKAVKKDEKN